MDLSKKSIAIDKNTVLTVVLSIILFLINIRNISILNGPFVFNDELGYLSHAAAIAGHDWHEIMHDCAWYSYGWSIIISPLFMITSNMQIIYRCINILNALLCVAVFIMQKNLLLKFFDGNKSLLTVISACVCCYPAVLCNTSMALSEMWLLFMFTIMTYFVYGMINNYKVYKSPLWAFLLYYYYVCHNRMIGVLIAGLLIYILLIVSKKVKIKDFLLFVAAFIVSLVIFGWIKDYLVSFNWHAGLPKGNDLDGGISAIKNIFTSVEGFKNFISVLSCQILYSCTSSLGMIPLGIYCMMKEGIKEIKEKNFKNTHFFLWLILSYLAMLGISSISTGAREDISMMRVDHIFYGRYFEPVSVMLIVIGLAKIPLYFNKTKYCVPIYSAITSILSVIAYYTVSKLEHPVFNRINAAGIDFYFDLCKGSIVFVFAFTLILNMASFIVYYCLGSSKSIAKYIGMCLCVVFFGVSTSAAEKSITVSQRNNLGDLDVLKTAQELVKDEDEVYSVLSGNGNAYVQTMLVDESVHFYKNISLDNIQEDEYYVFLDEENIDQMLMIDGNVIDSGCNMALVKIKNDDNTENKLEIPLSFLSLKPDSGSVFDKKTGSIEIPVKDIGGLAFYGPYVSVNSGAYDVNFEISCEFDKEINDLGVLQIYSNSNKQIYSELKITSDMLKSGEVTNLMIRADIPVDLNDMEIYLRTAPNVSYTLYSISLEEAEEYTYSLKSENTNVFDVSGFSHFEGGGAWTNKLVSEIKVNVPRNNYEVYVDFGYTVPFEKLNLEGYEVSVYFNDNKIGVIDLIEPDDDGIYCLVLPQEFTKHGSNILHFETDRLWSPSEYGSADTRQLGFSLESVEFKPAA